MEQLRIVFELCGAQATITEYADNGYNCKSNVNIEMRFFHANIIIFNFILPLLKNILFFKVSHIRFSYPYKMLGLLDNRKTFFS